MPRPRSAPVTALGAALVERRAGVALDVTAEELGLTHTTLSRLERGTNRPSADTARALARWLGWTTDQVLEAADQPAMPTDTPSQESQKK